MQKRLLRTTKRERRHMPKRVKGKQHPKPLKAFCFLHRVFKVIFIFLQFQCQWLRPQQWLWLLLMLSQHLTLNRIRHGINIFIREVNLKLLQLRLGISPPQFYLKTLISLQLRLLELKSQMWYLEPKSQIRSLKPKSQIRFSLETKSQTRSSKQRRMILELHRKDQKTVT